MKNILLKITGIAFALFLAIGFNSCVKDEFDQPPVLNIPVGEQVTVSEIASLALTSATPIKITEDKSMFGLVTMGEQSGNFYKQVVFEDASGGIMLEFLGSTSLNVGDSIQVNLNGARVYNYNNLPQIDSLEITYNVKKISAGNVFTPEEVSISDLKTYTYTGRVVKLSGVEFASSELGKTFADAVGLVTENRSIQDCDANTILVRTSGYANFAGELLPEGNGSLIAFVGRYRDDVQLALRSYTEVDMNGERCGGGGEWEVNSNIKAIKELYQGARLQIADDLVFEATIIADDQFGNYYKTIVVQDDQSGIEVKINDYDLYLTYAVGQKLLVSCKNLYVDTYGGVVQLGSVYNDNGEEKFGGIDPSSLSSHIQLISGGVALAPTVMEINSLNNEYLGMLIELQNVQFIEADLNKTYAESAASANRTLTNCNGTQTIVRTSSYADFAGNQIAQGNGSFVGILSAYNGSFQFLIRNVNDLDMNGERCDVGGGGGGGTVTPVDEINEDFQSLNEYDEITFEGWTSLSVAGDRNWIAQTFNAEVYVQASGYNSGLAEMETWLITPPVTNIQDKKLSFNSAMAYWAHGSNDPCAVLVSTDFVGDNFETATWTEINVTLANQSSGDHTWVESGEYDLSAFSGNAAIAFRYIGSATESTSFRIDDIVVTDGSGGGGGGGTGGTVDMINEDFSSQTNYEDIAIDGWVNVNVEGDRKWQGKTFESETYAQATGYNSGLAAMETWLITPKITDIGSKSLSLKTAMAYWAHGSDSPLTVYVSEDYDGENYETATWVEISVPMANQNSGDHTWVDSGLVDLSNFDGDAAIAFKFVGSATLSTSFRLDDILVQ
jgi:hypothetical protein